MDDFASLQSDFKRAAQRLFDRAESDPELHSPLEAVTARILAPGASLAEIIAAALEGYTDRPAFGTRTHEIRRDPATGRSARHFLASYTTITYGELKRQVEAIASAWRHHPQHRIDPGEFIAYIAFSGAQMSAIDLAGVYGQAINVPLQANLAREDMMEMLGDVAPAAMVSAIEHLALTVDYALEQPSVRSLIVIDADEGDDDEREAIETARQRLAEKGGRIALITFEQLVAEGSEHHFTPLPRSADGRDALAMIMYTSGSTGTPKGAMIHEAMLTQFWTEIQFQPIVTMAYAPMNHFMGRSMVYSTLAQGGVAYFTLKPDMSSLLEDIRLARPTAITFMPRFAEMIYQQYQSEVQRRVALGEDEAKADAAVRTEMHDGYLGDRLLSGAVGSAPTAPEVQAFLRDCFDISMVNGYGSTESCGRIVTLADRILRNVVIDYKLSDVPELGYYTTDKPYPRGELLLKTRLSIKGYFKRPDASAAIFDDDGWLMTGDIMEERGPDHVVWLDRRNNVIKLSQAEFVAIAPLEMAFQGGSPIIHQIYLYGSSYRAFLLAVVVPDLDVARSMLGHDPDVAELRRLILDEMRRVAGNAGLKSFEIPRDIIVELEPFSFENGLLSSVRKPLRPNLKRKYGDRIEDMYIEMDRQQQAELAALRTAGPDVPVADRVTAAFKASLGLPNIDPESSRCYRDMGGDSLGGVGLAMLLEEMFGISVPVSAVLSPTATIARLSRQIEAELSGERGMATFAEVHGEDATEVRADDLVLDAFLDSATLESARDLAPSTNPARTVLITGATGFLGRFLVLDWMEALAPVGGKVICLVRAIDAAQARQRLTSIFGNLDADLTERFATLARDHLEVLPGDLEEPNFGLGAEEFDRLSRAVDQIVHPGALVNHLLTYQNLFTPNVAGTAELIRLALTGRMKQFDYVSSMAVPATNRGLTLESEDADVRVFAPAMPLSNAYAMGYAASKWAGEILLRDANERFGLPVNVFRADMILPHSRYRGQINVPDMFTRLLLSIVATGLAPVSFYEREGGERPKAHYDGLPVDFLAGAMRQIGQVSATGFNTFNSINMHYDDGISLDSFVDWIRSAGYRVDRVDDYNDWIRRFAEKLRQLPDADKQHSMINILEPYAKPSSPHQVAARSERFVEAVRTIAIGPDIPHLTEEFIHKYLDDMRNLELIGHPALAEA
jgi:fatty acid CoA ligase FadD9